MSVAPFYCDQGHAQELPTREGMLPHLSGLNLKDCSVCPNSALRSTGLVTYRDQRHQQQVEHNTYSIYHEEWLCSSVVEGMLEEVPGSRQASRAGIHGRAPNPEGPWAPSFATRFRWVLTKGCPAQHCPLLGPEPSGNPRRGEPMGGRRHSLPCTSEHPFKGRLGGRLWLMAGKRRAQGS